MGSFSVWHWTVIIVLVLLLFGGRGKISGFMGDFAQGIKSLRKGLREEDATTDVCGSNRKPIDHQSAASAGSNFKQHAKT